MEAAFVQAGYSVLGAFLQVLFDRMDGYPRLPEFVPRKKQGHQDFKEASDNIENT